MSTHDLHELLKAAHRAKGYGFIRNTAQAIGISERQVTRWLTTGPFNPTYRTAEALRAFLRAEGLLPKD